MGKNEQSPSNHGKWENLQRTFRCLIGALRPECEPPFNQYTAWSLSRCFSSGASVNAPPWEISDRVHHGFPADWQHFLSLDSKRKDQAARTRVKIADVCLETKCTFSSETLLLWQRRECQSYSARSDSSYDMIVPELHVDERSLELREQKRRVVERRHCPDAPRLHRPPLLLSLDHFLPSTSSSGFFSFSGFLHFCNQQLAWRDGPFFLNNPKFHLRLSCASNVKIRQIGNYWADTTFLKSC